MLGRTIFLACGLWSFAALAPAAEPTVLHVNIFPNARSLPFYAGHRARLLRQARARTSTCNSPKAPESQRAALADGSVDIVHSAVDNAVAMIDVAKADIVIVSGGDSGTNEFYVQDDVYDFADIRGHAIVVDASQYRLCPAGEDNPAASMGSNPGRTIRSIRSATARFACRRC